MQSNDHAIRQRFERDFLPKYGSLWRCIEQTRTTTSVDFAEAIEKKAPVTIRGSMTSNEKECNCCIGKENEKTNGMHIIDLIEDSDTKGELDKLKSVDTSKVVEILSDSDEDIIPSTRPFDSSNGQQIRQTSSSFIDDYSSDCSSDVEFELDFSDHSDGENSFVEDLIESTKRLSVNGKENMRSFNQSKRRRIPMSKHSFKAKRESMTKELFDEFNRKAFGGKLDSVSFQWSAKLRTTAGLTRLRRSGRNMTPGIPLKRYATIELSKKVLDCQERLESTLLHEMVHAAAWIVDGQCKPPHGKFFWKWARIAMKEVPGIEVTTTHSYEIEYKYAWACSKPGCPFLVKRQSRSVDIEKHCCGRCKGRLVEVNATTSRTEKKRSPPSGYNLFVKEQSKLIREKLMAVQRTEGQLNPKVSQSDVMKECARLWQQKKAVETG